MGKIACASVQGSAVKLANERAWDQRVDSGHVWTLPVSPEAIASARRGEVHLSLGGDREIPAGWLPSPAGKVLCLASGGGQQGPLFAALGWETTVLDLSSRQLEQDWLVADREDLMLRTVKGDMCDLSMFADGEFDLVFCPVSVTYVPDVLPVFREVHRVLKPGGIFLFGTTNPHVYIFDLEGYDTGQYRVTHSLPTSDLEGLDEQEQRELLASGQAIEYSHSMESLVGGLLAAGFAMTGFFESGDEDPICRYFGKYFNVRAVAGKR